MRGSAAKSGVGWLILVALIEASTAYAGHRVAVWGAATMATLLMTAYALLALDFNFLQRRLWHTVGGLLGAVVVVGVTAAYL